MLFLFEVWITTRSNAEGHLALCSPTLSFSVCLGTDLLKCHPPHIITLVQCVQAYLRQKCETVQFPPRALGRDMCLHLLSVNQEREREKKKVWDEIKPAVKLRCQMPSIYMTSLTQPYLWFSLPVDAVRLDVKILQNLRNALFTQPQWVNSRHHLI